MSNKNPNQFGAYLAITWYSFLAAIRNKATFYFGFIFPVVFISVFGVIGTSTPSVKVGIPTETNTNNPIIETLRAVPVVKLEENNADALIAKLNQGRLDGILVVAQDSIQPPQYRVALTTTSGNPQGATSTQAIMKGVIDNMNVRFSGITTPPITYQTKEVGGRQFRYIDFALPGQIGFAVLSTALFSTVFGFIALKKELVFKRLFTTPMQPLTFLLGQGTSRLIVSLLQTSLIVIVGVLVFHFYLPHGIITFFELILLAAIGLVAFLGFGYFIAGLANDENAAGPLVNIVSLPQFLLSGTFFSTENFPSWVQPIANNLPLTYLNTAVRKVTTEGQDIIVVWPYVLGLLAWGIVMYVLAARTFKWE